jgi:voltage-gated potassium channel
LVGLVIFSTHALAGPLSFFLLGSIILAVVLCHTLLPGSLFFSLALANLISVYACFFFVILDSHFRQVSPYLQWAGFVAPLGSFFIGVLLRRRQIRTIIRERTSPAPADFAHALLWLVPITLIGLGAMVYSSAHHSVDSLTLVFIAAMCLSSVLVLAASRDVALFMLDTGLLFEDFFRRGSKLLAPMFAFFTFYSVTVIIYAALYASIDEVTDHAHFRILGELKQITFSESLYFSVATLATVGYGDIIPSSNLMRMLAASEVLVGVALLLFGFNEILRYGQREHQNKDGK